MQYKGDTQSALGSYRVSGCVNGFVRVFSLKSEVWETFGSLYMLIVPWLNDIAELCRH